MPKLANWKLDMWAPVMREYNGCCAGCSSTLDLEYDHVVPRKRGGSDHPSNMQILCHHCNNAKNGMVNLPRLSPRQPVDSCAAIRENRLAFLVMLESKRVK